MIQDERSAVEERQFREDGRRMGGEVVSEVAALARGLPVYSIEVIHMARRLAEAVLAKEPRWCHPCALLGGSAKTLVLVERGGGEIPLCRACWEREVHGRRGDPGVITSRPYEPSDLAQLALEALETLGPEGGR